MNSKAKRKLIVVTGIIIIVVIVVLAVVGSNGAARSVSVAQAASGDLAGQKIQVSGNVVQDSYEINNNVLTFSIYDKESGSSEQLRVRSEGSVSSTFGNDVTAICTGKIDDSGVLQTTEPIVTKCPSKYESNTSALSVEQLFGYGSKVYGKTVKVSAIISDNGLNSIESDVRFTLHDASKTNSQDDTQGDVEGSAQGGVNSSGAGLNAGTSGNQGSTSADLPVCYTGAMPDNIAANSEVVVTGSLNEDGKFYATDVALAK